MENLNKVPQHVAIIMDGNGRWAREKGFARIHGHQKGVDSIRDILRAARELGVKYLTLYAFSRENWGRPQNEIDFLMNLLAGYLDSELPELKQEQIKFNAIGRLEDLPEKIQAKINRNINETKNNHGLLLTLALSYSSRIEITDAVKHLCERVKNGELKIEDIDEYQFSNSLYTAGIPDPDLLIRTSGELRVSNFLLWQISYTEIFVTPKFWPEFSKSDFIEAIKNFSKRERRFGLTETAKLAK